MKKSRVIIPALAMIAFSVAASITGAVAWFTASRTASIDAGTYTVVKTSAELEYKLTRGAGTTVNQAGDTVSVSGVLTDGSLDHDSSIIYTPAADGRSLLPANNDKRAIALTEEVSGETQYKAYSDYESLLERGSTVARQDNPSKTIYTAVTFELEFTVTFGEVAGDIGLFLDNTEELVNNVLVKKSHFEVDGTPKTAKGFRMAFLPHEAAGNAKIFADLQDEKVDVYNDANPPVKTGEKTISKGTDVEFVGTDDTGMTTVQTIYFIGLIVLLCGVGIVYANAKPVQVKQ